MNSTSPHNGAPFIAAWWAGGCRAGGAEVIGPEALRQIVGIALVTSLPCQRELHQLWRFRFADQRLLSVQSGKLGQLLNGQCKIKKGEILFDMLRLGTSGMTAMPFWVWKRSRTCAGVLPYFSARASTAGSRYIPFRLPCPSGA